MDFEHPFSKVLPSKSSYHLDIGSGEKFRYSNLVQANNRLINDASKQYNFQQTCFLGNALDLNIFLKPKLFDLITCFDAIEHFKKEDGLKLIKDLENLCNKRLIFFTPLGNLGIGLDKTPYHTHLSGWFPEDFTKLNYTCWVFPKFHIELNFGAFFAIKDYSNIIETKGYAPYNSPVFEGNYWL